MQPHPDVMPGLALLHGLRMLYVDVCANGRLMMEDLLQGCGVDIDIAADTVQALALLHASVQPSNKHQGVNPYQAILISLADEQPQECEVVRANEAENALSSLKIIFLVPLGRRPSDRTVAHVTKPVRLANLVTRLKIALELETEEHVDEHSDVPMSQGAFEPRRLETVVAEDIVDRLHQFKMAHGEVITEELFSLFLDETPMVIAHIRQAIRNRDDIALQQELYRLQSSSGIIRLRETEQLCIDLVKQAEDGQIDDLEERLEVIAHAVKRVQKELT